MVQQLLPCKLHKHSSFIGYRLLTSFSGLICLIRLFVAFESMVRPFDLFQILADNNYNRVNTHEFVGHMRVHSWSVFSCSHAYSILVCSRLLWQTGNVLFQPIPHFKAPVRELYQFVVLSILQEIWKWNSILILKRLINLKRKQMNFLKVCF